MFGINFSKYGINSAIFLITILLLSLVLCSFLGEGNCSGKKREGMTSSSTPEQIPTEYIGIDGSKATLIDNVVTTTNGGIIDTFNATKKEKKREKKRERENSSSSNSATEFKSDNTGNYARLTNTQQTDDINKTSIMIYTITVTDTSNNNNIIGNYIANITVPYVPPTPTNGSIDINEGGSNEGGSNGGDYSHYSGINIPNTYYANGKTLRVFYANGVYYITVTDPVSGTIYYNSTAATDQASLTKYTFTGTNGGSAIVYKISNHKGNKKYAAKVTYPDGQVVIYTASGPTVDNNSEMYNNNTNTYTATSGSSGTAYSGPNATVYTTDTPYTATPGSVAYNNGYDYSSSNPQGVSRSNIPEGDEDLYMLKSQIVPPVCPICPGCNKTVNSSTNNKCQPCPACARCPKPAFDCKKVPNYNTIDDSFLPSPVMNTAYSTYGM
jgi:hypothetical protein